MWLSLIYPTSYLQIYYSGQPDQKILAFKQALPYTDKVVKKNENLKG